MAYNLLKEDGFELLKEDGFGFFQEDYVAPDNPITGDVVVGDVAVSATLRVNTPKFWTIDLVMNSGGEVALTELFSSDPDKFITVDVVAGEPVVTLANIGVATPRHYTPIRHHVWIYGLNGQRVNVVT